MSALEWVLVGVAGALAVLVAVLAAAVRMLGRTVRELADRFDELREETLPLLADTRAALRRSEGAKVRTDALLDVATSLTSTADSASRLAYRVVSNPLVKVMAFFTGTGRAARRLAQVTAPGGAAQRGISAGNQAARAAKARRALPTAAPTPPRASPRASTRAASPTRGRWRRRRGDRG